MHSYAQRGNNSTKGILLLLLYDVKKMFSSINTSVLFDEGFVRSASMILASEIGDKTFFIAAVMAMTHSRATVILREFWIPIHECSLLRVVVAMCFLSSENAKNENALCFEEYEY
jgi:hypothetical protein